MKRFSLTLILVAILALTASADWRFVDVSADGMSWDPSTMPFEPPYASCVAWGDVDNDGTPDLFMGSNAGADCRLYIYEDRVWTDHAESWGVHTLENIRSAQFIDYDQDGRLDLFCLTDNAASAELFRQNENNRFQPVDLGLELGGGGQIESAVWADVDNDGALDVILNRLSGGDRNLTALVNTGTQFIPARAGGLPENLTGVRHISAIDFDRDGDLDYLLGSNTESRFYVNHDGQYTNLLSRYGFARNVGATGMAWADFNNDGYFDFATCGAAEESYLYMGGAVNGEIGFRELFHSAIRPNDYLHLVAGASSVHAVDANSDGWTDLFYVGTSDIGNCLLMNLQGDGWALAPNYRDVTSPSFTNEAAAWADFDGDGDLDLVLAQHERGIKLLQNVPEDRHEYFKVRLAGYTTDTPVLNCQIRVKFENSKQWRTTSQASATVGFDDNTCLFVNPALGEHSRVITIAVTWPTGAVSVYDIDDIDLYGTITLRPPLLTPHPGTELVRREAQPELSVDLSNSPNPFNPSTSVSFTVPSAGDVTLSVFNLLGQEVATLVSGYQDAGLHRATFDASALPSGLYFARLQTSGQTVLHRMLLTK